MRKKGIAIVLTICMMHSFTAGTAWANGSNISFEVDKMVVDVGEKIEVMITNDEMTVSGFGGYLEFDTDLLECTSVIGMIGEEEVSEEGSLMPVNGKAPAQFMVYDNIASTNKDGIHSFAYVSTKDTVYKPGIISKLTFTAKEPGTVTLSLIEDSSGTDAYKDVAKTQEISINKKAQQPQAPTPVPTPVIGSDNTGFESTKEYKSKIILQIGNKEIKIDDRLIENDTAPVIVDSRTMVPIRVIVEALGGTADWNNDTRTVTLHIDEKELKLTIDQGIPGFGTGAMIMDSRTYVPVRYVAEYVGAYVEWIAQTQQIVIQK